jgi:cyclophilin family peptidyl-prolyl cis-trans isomerase
MMRILSLALVVVLVVSCASSKNYYRPLTKAEAADVKAATKIWGRKNDAYRVLILTDSGNMVVRLYNETPLHRDNFVSKVSAGFYDSLLFHRVIKNFMIQGGDPESKYAKSGQSLGSGSAPGDRIPAEIHTNDLGLYHKKGVLAAARDNNPDKASSNCQFYIAQGLVFTEKGLDSAAKKRGYQLHPLQRQLYTTVGGIPHLDGNYTVYGELESGIEVLDKIAATKTGTADRPVKDIRMHMFVVSEKKP